MDRVIGPDRRTTLLDRLSHHGHILEMNGDGLHLKRRGQILMPSQLCCKLVTDSGRKHTLVVAKVAHFQMHAADNVIKGVSQLVPSGGSAHAPIDR